MVSARFFGGQGELAIDNLDYYRQTEKCRQARKYMDESGRDRGWIAVANTHTSYGCELQPESILELLEKFFPGCIFKPRLDVVKFQVENYDCKVGNQYHASKQEHLEIVRSYI